MSINARKIVLSLLLLSTIGAGLAFADSVVVWQQECASGDYAIIPGDEPAVIVECYEAVSPTPTPTPEPTATYIPTVVAGENQLVNPEFIGVHNSTVIPDWDNNIGGDGQYVISYNANKTKNQTTTGYAAKWGPVDRHGEGVPGISGYLEQVVPFQGRTLISKITAIHVRASVANYNIYARNGNEEWQLVWQPFTIEDVVSKEWTYLESSTTLNQDYDEYKVQLESRWDGTSLGVKWGDAFFSSG